MANEFSTAGVTVKYAVEATSGTRPTTGFTLLPGVKGTPDFNTAPEQIEVTDLSDTEYRRYIPGLKSVDGSASFTANLTTAFKTAWDACVAAAEAAQAESKSCWFEICIPNFDSFYFAGVPVPLGVSAMEVGNVAEVDAYVTPNVVEGWATAST